MSRVMLAVFAVLVASCGGKNPLTGSGTVVYHVSGTATRADVTYSGSGGSTLQQGNVTLPWQASISVHTGDFLYISAQNAGSTGCVSVDITSGSKTLQTGQSCGAFVIATVSTTY